MVVRIGYDKDFPIYQGPASLTDLARETGATPVSVIGAAHSGDVVIITIPEKNIAQLPADLFAGLPTT